MADPKVKRVLISVTDKTGVVEFARALHDEFGAEIISTGGTARVIAEAGVPVTPIDEVTKFPEMMDGRVKTLHPMVHGGLLAKRDNAKHMAEAAEHGIQMIDMVVVNLYAFEKTVESGADFGTCIENIDIGGPSMLRSAAKNFESVTVVTDPETYEGILAEMRANGGATTRETRMELALEVFETTNAYDGAMTLEDNLRQSFFQVASIITTTGFATTDFNLWPGFSHGILVVLMFVGACAGSTGGGFKVSRIVIGFKSVLAYLGAFLHPRVVRKVKFENKDVDGETMRAISAYFTAAISLFTISVLLVALDGFDLVTTFSAVAATFNNVGPGLGVAGPTSNFAAFSDFSKVVMTMDMLLGRLEVFPMLMLFYPPLWKESIGEARIRRNRSPFH